MNDFASYQGGQKGFDWEQEIKKLALRYNGRGEGEIMKEIFARAAASKKNGTLTNGEIDEFYARFAPALDGARKKKLEKLIKQLKEM